MTNHPHRNSKDPKWVPFKILWAPNAVSVAPFGHVWTTYRLLIVPLVPNRAPFWASNASLKTQYGPLGTLMDPTAPL